MILTDKITKKYHTLNQQTKADKNIISNFQCTHSNLCSNICYSYLSFSGINTEAADQALAGNGQESEENGRSTPENSGKPDI